MMRVIFYFFAVLFVLALSGCSMSDIFPKWNDPAYFGDENDLGKHMNGSGTGNETWESDW